MGFRRPAKLIKTPYSRFRPTAATGMMCLFSGHGPGSQLIQAATDSDYSHIGAMGWCSGVLMLAESVRPFSRAVSLSSQVKACPGIIDVYEFLPRVSLDVEEAFDFMLRAAGQDYPEEWIVNNWLRIHWGQWVEPIPNDNNPEIPRHCSGTWAAATRCAGMKPIREFDSDSYPDMWADPLISQYVCTLV